MIIVTSLSSKHANVENQHQAVNSWQKFGNCYTLNSPEESKQIYGVYNGITYLETDRTMQHLVNKPLVSINALIDLGFIYDDDVLLVNSDIVLKDLPDFKMDGITIISRYDYRHSFDDGEIFNAGFDVFFLPKKFLHIFPPTLYGMGFSHWDYSLPYRFMIKELPVYWPQERYAFHKWHETQYSVEQWLFIAEFFRWEFKLPKHMNAGQIATDILLEIKQNAIK